MLNKEEIKETNRTKKELFEKQKQTLDLFLARGAISKQQYDGTLKALREKMKLT